MAGYPIFTGYDDSALVDHQHERLHQHNTFLGVLARRKPDPKAHPNQPDVDFSDDTTAYLIDLEVPGVKDPAALTIRWLNPRHLVIAGTTTRPWHPRGAYYDESAPLSSASSALQVEVEEGSKLPPWLIIAERRIGAFRREFHFPVDVDMQRLDARLDAGLLHVVAPKKPDSCPENSGKVKIEAGEGRQDDDATRE